MGDRGWMQVTFRTEDKEKIYEAFGPGEWEEDDVLNSGDGTIRQTWAEMNYGGYDERLELATAGVLFFGWHSAGDNYDSYRFAAHDGEMNEWQTTQEGKLVVCAEGGVDLEEAQEVLAYIEFEKEAERQVHNRPQENTNADEKTC